MDYITISYELYYPDNTAIMNMGVSAPMVQNRILHGYFNLGIPFNKLKMTISPSLYETTENTENTNIVGIFMNAGLMICPLQFWDKTSKFKPIIQGGVGLYVIADDWSTLFLALFSSSNDTYDPETNKILMKRMDLDIQFSCGLGCDYLINDELGFRFSVKKQKFNLPDMKGSMNPLEIDLGLVLDVD